MVVGQHDIEDGYQEEQEGKNAQEGRKGQVGDQSSRVIVAKFLHDAEDQGGGTEALLGDVDATQYLFEWIHEPAVTLSSDPC